MKPYNRISNVETTCCGTVKRRSVAKWFALLSIASGMVALIAASFILGYKNKVYETINQEHVANQNAYRLNLIMKDEYYANLRKFTFERAFIFGSWIFGFIYAGLTVPKGILLVLGLQQDKANIIYCWLVIDMVSNILGIFSVCGVFIVCGILVFYTLLNVGLAFLLLISSTVFLVALFYSWTNVYKLHKTIRMEQDVIIRPDELT